MASYPALKATIHDRGALSTTASKCQSTLAPFPVVNLARLSRLVSIGPPASARTHAPSRSLLKRRRIVTLATPKGFESEAERFVATLEAAEVVPDETAEDAAYQAQLQDQLQALLQEETRLSAAIDSLYDNTFRGVEVRVTYDQASAAAAAATADADIADVTSTAAEGAGGEVKEAEEEVARAVAVAGSKQEDEEVEDGGAAGEEQQQQQQEEEEEEEEEEGVVLKFESMSEGQFSSLLREQPAVVAALMAAAEAAAGAGAWREFQSQVSTLKLQRSRTTREAEELRAALAAAQRSAASNSSKRTAAAAAAADSSSGQAAHGLAVPLARPGGGTAATRGGGGGGTAGAAVRDVRIVLLSGFESFNVGLYKEAAGALRRQMPHVTLQVFSDRDLTSEPSRSRVEAALARADIFFGSLIFDFDQVEWLRSRVERVPVRLVFESALELMACNKVGSFTMGGGGGGGAAAKGPGGPPPAVKKLLSMFGSGREEDKMVGYLSFLKLGPKLLKWVPGQKAADLRTWLTAYAYWNQGGPSNVVAMFAYLVEAAVQHTGYVPPPIIETPALGCLHPLYDKGYFSSPAEYMKWYGSREGPLRGRTTDAPVVAVLLYRKHVITEQPYVRQLVSQLEAEGLLPVPIFINGVEAHTVVRDLLTTQHEQSLLARGETGAISPTLKRDAVRVDAIVSTIGFPLVGGPAGSMEGGRQAEVAKAILTSKDVPYMVAAPLLIQDMESWSRDGVAGLQSVVLYSLPELDGAVDCLPLGGLVGDNIYLVPERVKKLAGRLRAWVNLRRKAPADRKVAVLLYGFPPGVGATGTAALLNVPKSLETLLVSLRRAGYDLGPDVPEDLAGVGEALVAALRRQTEDQRAVSVGAAGMAALGPGPAAPFGVRVGAGEMGPVRLKELLSYPPDWGPSEWGPLPYLPDPDVLVQRMERQWGDLRGHRGILTSSRGLFQVPGLQLGRVWLGVQPALGLEGDPMRLLFQRDLTPHPQYAAFYKWLQHEYGADVVLHFGMHGTVEWLPGSPLGNTGLSWSDVLLGELPNVYVYAANNPSESIIAKRRGYGTIVSHNVPPYGRAGLYKQLATLRDQLAEYRETAQAVRQSVLQQWHQQQQEQQQQQQEQQGEQQQAQPQAGGMDALLRAALAPVVAGQAGAVMDQLRLAGLEADCPFQEPSTGQLMPLPPAEAFAALTATTPASSTTTDTTSAAVAAAHTSSAPASSAHTSSAPVSPAHTSSAPQPPPVVPPQHPALDPLVFDAYASKLYAYLQLLEGRLFSEGLHVLGSPPSPSQLGGYLEAFFGGGLPRGAVQAVAERGEAGAEAVRSQLERLWEEDQVAISPFEAPLPAAASSQQPTAAAAPSSALAAAAAAAAATATAPGLAAPEAPTRPTREQLVARLEEALKIRSLLLRNTEVATSTRWTPTACPPPPP
ncbi:hypothetical protein Agub_g3011 [Astrephomene gubernaculifera]|uniref:magnesium chelatase n=1 Tax=Astrephomene gubernaculifera TaxID=47775 RepID=A0AAD3DJ55_9CHLO|nr:hypothetical protein Agub_g3011 [Astrephomene gubernaculifera]